MAAKTTKIGKITFKQPSWEYQAIATLSYIITSLFGGLPNYNNAQIPFTIKNEFIVEHKEPDYKNNGVGRNNRLYEKVLENPDEKTGSLEEIK